MTYSQQQFLNQFDQPIRNYIIEYCRKISEKRYDVYMLMARKAACFISVLESLGFISLNGVVVSDRVQEFNCDWLKGKKIAIIDDTIISGTTINRLIEKLESFGVAEVIVHAFCVDAYWYNDEMLKYNGHDYLVKPYMKLEHSSCLRFCRQIVNALSVIPRPYNIDFPTYEIHKLTRHRYQNLLSDTNWKIVNTTSFLQYQNEVHSYSLNFTKEMLDQFFSSIGVDLRNVMFTKVRLFSKKLIDNKNPKSYRYYVRVVPYVIFNKIQVSMVDSIVSAICRSEGKDELHIYSELVTDSAKMIFIQYYFSEMLRKWWVNYTELLLNKELDAAINKRSLSLLFSPSIIEIVSDFKYDNPIQIEKDITNLINQIPKIEYAVGDQGINPFEVRDCLTNVFLDMYYQKELPARRLALKQGRAIFSDQSKSHYFMRLECGVSLLDLKVRVAECINNSTDANLFLSTFLDNYVDAGLAVPITINDNGYLYRGYRHGEEVIWGDANDKMLAIFFERLFGKNGTVPKLQFEKLLSLFVKLGLKKGLLSDLQLSLPKSEKVKILGIRSYLYGQVAVEYEILPGQFYAFNPVLDTENTGQWTTSRFKDLGLIKENSLSGYELHFENLRYLYYEKFREENEADDLDKSKVNDIHNMADVFKLCYENKLLNDNNLVLLTSCVSVLDNIFSLNAEIVLFKNGMQAYINRILGAIADNITVDFLRDLRNIKKQKLWTAVNSGKMKYVNFKQEKGISLIKEIETKLGGTNGFAARSWWDFWQQEMQLEGNDDDLNELNNKSGRILIDALNVMTCLHIFLYECLYREGKTKEYENSINQLIDKNKRRKKFLLNQIDGDHSNEIKIELNKIDKEITALNREHKKWSEYVSGSCKLIETNLSVIPEEEYKLMRYTELYQEITTGRYKDISDNELSDLIQTAIYTIEQLKTDADAIYQEYQIVAQFWGKMENYAQYVSIIHIKQLDDNGEILLDNIVKTILSDVELEEYPWSRKNKSLTVLHTNNEIFNPTQGIVVGGKGERHVERMLKVAGRLLIYCKDHDINVSISFFPDFRENGVRVYYNEHTRCVDLLKKEIYSLLPVNNDGMCINVYTEKQLTEYSFYSMLRKKSFHGRLKVVEVGDKNATLKFKIIEQPVSKKIFISYSRKEIGYKEQLLIHLNFLKMFRVVDTWACEDLKEDTWSDEIQKELETSAVVIYMLSANFFNSSYIIQREVCNVMGDIGHRKVLCVLVDEFVSLDKIEEFIQNKIGKIDEESKAILKLKEFEFLPYGRVRDPISGNEQLKLITLGNYRNTTGNTIDTAFKSIAERVLKLLETI